MTLKSQVHEVIGDYSMAGARRFETPMNVRAGRNVMLGPKNILDDSAPEVSKNRTSRVVVRRKDGKILVVVDPNDSFKISLPGGRFEPGETPLDAARRELWEETGLIPDDMLHVRSDVFDDREINLFLCKNPIGKLRGSSEGDVAWVDPSQLFSSEYGEYYKMIEKYLKKVV